jgi:3-oxoadipate enol-lactonase
MKSHAADIAFATSEGVRTAYRKVGEGPLLFLIHGGEADHTMFAGLMQALAGSFTVVAYDQRDSGQTENGNAPYGIEDLASDAAKLIAIVGKAHGVSRGHVFGTSFGGQIAQALAVRYPALVDRLVLGSTWRVGRTVAEINPQAMRELVRLRADTQANAPAIAAYFFTQEYMEAHPEAIDIFRGTKRSAAQQQRRAQMMQAAPPRVDFARVSAPTLLLAGAGDKLIPTSATFELADHIVGTQRTELAGLPHVSALEAPEQVAAAIRPFLER